MELPNLLRPSGQNDHFSISASLPFAEYIRQTRKMLQSCRADLQTGNAEAILDINSPFEYYPASYKTGKIEHGILLIHGLYDCPFMLQEIGRFLQAQGFLVRAILLPGHGSVPADLFYVSYIDWLKAVDYGVNSLAAEVNKISIAGYSLGGLLATHKALQDTRISRLLLFSPALKIRSEATVKRLIFWQRYLIRLIPMPKWYQQRPKITSAKYQNYCCS